MIRLVKSPILVLFHGVAHTEIIPISHANTHNPKMESSQIPIPTPIPSPIITTPLFQIRPYHPSDVTSCTAAINSNSPLIAKYMRNTFPNPATLAGTETWIQTCMEATFSPREILINYAIVSGDEFIGSLGFKPMKDIEYRTFEIGYWVRHESWGKGIMTAAVREFVRWGFETFPELERIEAQVFDDNEASAKVLTKAGFLFEGARRRAGYKPTLGGLFDIRMYGVTKGDVFGDKA
ncbi:acyl-CoA N-acyltransferase [Podospora fimiseda]|uniref:Acyl-CoA N-acyltransferase n=1 Tax=Podospora fimiseda TaxID=252190 RepID=A0AAN7BUL1_9PEZI|nr:acyl-CoA N-acyltransferase [Podospora fimiseda]